MIKGIKSRKIKESRLIFAHLSIIKYQTCIGAFPQIISFFEKKTKDIHKLQNLRISIINGILYHENEIAYAMLFDGNESLHGIYIADKDMNKIPIVDPDTEHSLISPPCILLSDYRLDDHTFVTSLIVHEIAHFLKNSMVGESPSHDYESDPDEVFARQIEEEALTALIGSENTQIFLQNKYFP